MAHPNGRVCGPSGGVVFSVILVATRGKSMCVRLIEACWTVLLVGVVAVSIARTGCSSIRLLIPCEGNPSGALWRTGCRHLAQRNQRLLATAPARARRPQWRSDKWFAELCSPWAKLERRGPRARERRAHTIHLLHLSTTSKILGVLSNPKGLLLVARSIWQVTDIATDAAFPLSRVSP